MSREQQQHLAALVAIEQRFRAKHCADRPADSTPYIRPDSAPFGRHTDV